MPGPLQGVRVVELAGLGPGPFCGMVLGDLGAEVVRVDRAADAGLALPVGALTARNRRSVAVDLKHPRGAEVVLSLVAGSQVLIEGFRPGVAERLGVGPEVCLARNPALVYGRMTGYGQDGPLAAQAGHDIDYIALSGALHAVGPAERPLPPLNLVGDYGGGGMLLAVGVLAALHHAALTGEGQVVDASMVDGSALLMTPIYELHAAGVWDDRRASNLLDGGAPFYRCYQTADGEWLAVGALEPQFYAELLERLGLDRSDLPDQMDRSGWPRLAAVFTERFHSRTRAEWEETFAGSDACVAPVLSLREAPQHPHNRHRQTFVDVGGVTQPAPAPRFSVTTTPPAQAPPTVGEHTDQVLAAAGWGREEINRLREEGAVR
jgi:alpha-methylacyl-CoA racemase